MSTLGLGVLNKALLSIKRGCNWPWL